MLWGAGEGQGVLTRLIAEWCRSLRRCRESPHFGRPTSRGADAGRRESCVGRGAPLKFRRRCGWAGACSRWLTTRSSDCVFLASRRSLRRGTEPNRITQRNKQRNKQRNEQRNKQTNERTNERMDGSAVDSVRMRRGAWPRGGRRRPAALHRPPLRGTGGAGQQGGALAAGSGGRVLTGTHGYLRAGSAHFLLRGPPRRRYLPSEQKANKQTNRK